MPEHIRALVAVIFLGGLVFYIARPFLIKVVSLKTFQQWRRLWFITTLAWFLAHNFWIYALVMALVLHQARKTESHIFGLFLLLVLAAPPSEMAIPGFGIVDHLFILSHYRLLCLALLLPAAFRLRHDAETPKWGASPVDWPVLGYLLWISILGFRETSLTNGLRIVFLNFIDFFLPYYVGSRSLRSTQDLRAVLAAFIAGAMIVAAIALVEVLRGWRLYSASAHVLGFFNYPLSYKMRGPFLRPAATVIDSIMVGWVIVVSMGGLLMLAPQLSESRRLVVIWGLVGVGVIASMSRAPWLAALLLIAVFILQAEKPVTKLMKIGLPMAGALMLASLSPVGESIIAMLPFVGEAEQGSVEYRANWFTVAGVIVERNFFFGDVRVLDAPEVQVMRQGEGIVDLVNTFLAILLYFGSIGLVLYLAAFVQAIFLVQRTKRLCDDENMIIARILISVVVVNVFMLMTVSAILVAPILVYSSLGLCAAFGLIQLHHAREDQGAHLYGEKPWH